MMKLFMLRVAPVKSERNMVALQGSSAMTTAMTSSNAFHSGPEISDGVDGPGDCGERIAKASE
jgi:hypothetical protein